VPLRLKVDTQPCRIVGRNGLEAAELHTFEVRPVLKDERLVKPFAHLSDINLLGDAQSVF
jgi:hypothetical protein